MKWLTGVVDVIEFFTCIKGILRGESFDSEWPPSFIFTDSALCKKYYALICDVCMKR